MPYYSDDSPYTQARTGVTERLYAAPVHTPVNWHLVIALAAICFILWLAHLPTPQPIEQPPAGTHIEVNTLSNNCFICVGR